MLWADGLQDNIPEKVRPVPPLGIELSDSDKKELLSGVDVLRESVKQLRQRDDVYTVELLPDVEIFLRAVTQGIKYRELFSARDVKNAANVLAEGQKRADALLKGEAPWTSQKGLVVRGFRSRIDRTVQPYGLVIPDSYTDRGESLINRHMLTVLFIEAHPCCAARKTKDLRRLPTVGAVALTRTDVQIVGSPVRWRSE